ncbi:MAG: glycosyltransferase family 9 protein [Oligoflexia bacterium]|nr:glycosyltransferase family 9 protein [Oligoflexia bacterium]
MKESFRPLLEGQKNIKSVFGFKKMTSESESTLYLLSQIEEQYDLILDLQNSWRTYFWRESFRKLGPLYVLPKSRLREIAILFLRLKKTFGYGRGGRMNRYQSFAQKCIGKKMNTLGTNLEYSSDLKKFNLPEQYLVFVPSSAWKTKVWPFFGELAKMLHQWPIVLLGADQDQVCSEIFQQSKENVINLQGKTSIQESASVLSKAKLILGSDTGMIHIAEAIGKSVFVIEGPTEESLGFSPYRKDSKSIGLDLFCRPCSKSGRICYRMGSRKCLNGISPEMVYQQIKENLNQ